MTINFEILLNTNMFIFTENIIILAKKIILSTKILHFFIQKPVDALLYIMALKITYLFILKWKIKVNNFTLKYN